MESSSKTFGDHGAEEYQSGESGWTMYLGSSMNDDDEEDDGHVDDHSHGMKKKKKVYVDDGYDGSDDSMASDASSGPSHQHQQQQQPWEGDGEGGHGHGHGDDHGMAHKYHEEDKVKKQVKKKKNIKTGFEARNEQRDECLVDEKRSIVTVQSGNKATYKGQRK